MVLDQKSPHLFFLHFESMIYKYRQYQILGHIFDKKSEFLDYELSIKLPAITQFKNGRVQRVGSREDVTSILRRVLFVYARLGKDYAVKLLRCLIGRRHIHPRLN